MVHCTNYYYVKVTLLIIVGAIYIWLEGYFT